MPISFGVTSSLAIDQNLTVGGTAQVTSALTLSSTTASSLLYGNASKAVASVTLSSNLSLTTGTLALAAALTGINSITAASATDLTLSGGSSGASILLPTPVASVANVVITPKAASGSNQPLIIGNNAFGGTWTVLHAGTSSPASTNYMLGSDGTSTIINAPTSGGSLFFRQGGTTKLTMAATTGDFSIASTTPSTNTTSGSLINAGGFGNAGAAYIGGAITTGAFLDFSANSAGNVSGYGLYRNTASNVGVGITSSFALRAYHNTSTGYWIFQPGTPVQSADTTASTSTTTGSLINAGGFGNAGAGYFGGAIYHTVSGNPYLQMDGTTLAGNMALWFRQASPSSNNYGLIGTTTTTYLNVATGGTLGLRVGNGDALTILAASGAAFSAGYPLRVNDTTASTSTTTGSAIFGGGIGVAGAGWFGANGVFTGANSVLGLLGAGTSTQYITFNTSGGNYYMGVSNSAGAGLFGGGAYAMGIGTESARALVFGTTNAARLTIAAGGDVSVSSTTSAATSTTGALTVGNGTAATNVGIGGGNINAGGTLTVGGAATFASTADFSGDITRIGSGNPTIYATSTTGTVITKLQSIASTAGAIGTQSAHDLRLQAGNTTALTLANSTLAATFAGAVTVGSSRPVAMDGTSGFVSTQGSAGGWNVGLKILGSAGTALGGMWANGTSDGLNSLHIGTGNFATSLLTITSAGAATFAGAVTTSSTTLSGAGAIPITTSLVKFTSTGAAQALTLADGTDGQRLTIVHDVDGGSGVLTPTTKTGFTTVTFTNAGDTVSLVYVTTRGWMVTGSYLAVIA